MNSVDSNWKKQWKQSLCEWQNLAIFAMLYAMISMFLVPIFMVLTEKSPNLLFAGITFFITSLIFLYILSEDVKERQRDEELDKMKTIYQEAKQENFYDILSEIEVLVEEHTYDITEGDAPLLDEVEKILQDIEYIEEKCDISGSEAEEILIQIPKQIRLILQNYFEIFPEYRKELVLELLPTIREQREVLHKTYIQPYQNTFIHVCKESAENLRGQKREYLYIQD